MLLRRVAQVVAMSSGNIKDFFQGLQGRLGMVSRSQGSRGGFARHSRESDPIPA